MQHTLHVLEIYRSPPMKPWKTLPEVPFGHPHARQAVAKFKYLWWKIRHHCFTATAIDQSSVTGYTFGFAGANGNLLVFWNFFVKEAGAVEVLSVKTNSS